LFPRTLAQPGSFSSIYCIGGFREFENGRHVGLQRLFTLMGSNGLRFYKSQDAGSNKGPDGLIAKNDVGRVRNCRRIGQNVSLLSPWSTISRPFILTYGLPDGTVVS
jgi:hypothetical protein